MTRIVAIQFDKDDFGVYSTDRRGPYDTPLVFRGTLAECIEWRKENRC